MKKILFLLTSLLAVNSALCFAGCNDKDNTKNGTVNDNVRTKINSVEDDENDNTCPDCKKHGMPKVRFEFKDGRPANKGDVKNGVEQPGKGHHKKHPHPPKHPRPALPEKGEQKLN